LLNSLNVLATSYPPPPPITIDIPIETAKCLGFNIANTDDSTVLEIEYPILIDNQLIPNSISVDYYKEEKLLFSNHSIYKETSNSHSVYIVFHQGFKGNDASISIGYKSIEKQESRPKGKQIYLYKIQSVKALYSAKNKTMACK
jgi:hypothetical protein